MDTKLVKIDVISGFLGAGKTTFIKKLVGAALKNEKVIIIENEFGEVGIDGGFLQDSGIEVKEMNSGCICCSLVGDFAANLKEVLEMYSPDRVIIEPSGVGKLSDVERAILSVDTDVNALLNSKTVVVDVTKYKMYLKNFGEFFEDQIKNADTVILSRLDKTNEAKLEGVIEGIHSLNEGALIVTTPISELEGCVLVELLDENDDLADELLEEFLEEKEHHHHEHGEECGCGEHHHEHEHHHEEHHHHEHGEECGCGEHHHEHEHHHEEHHHHEHGEECGCGEHHHEEHHHEEHHHHEHGEECGCGCGGDHEHHHHHGHHHADDVFTSFGFETFKTYTQEEIANILDRIEDDNEFGLVLRAKGMVKSADGWIHFDYVPGEPEIRSGSAQPTGLVVFIGTNVKEEELKALF